MGEPVTYWPVSANYRAALSRMPVLMPHQAAHFNEAGGFLARVGTTGGSKPLGFDTSPTFVPNPTFAANLPPPNGNGVLIDPTTRRPGTGASDTPPLVVNVPVHPPEGPTGGAPLGFQTAVFAPEPDEAGPPPAEPGPTNGKRVPWGWILGGGTLLILGGVALYAASRPGGRARGARGGRRRPRRRRNPSHRRKKNARRLNPKVDWSDFGDASFGSDAEGDAWSVQRMWVPAGPDLETLDLPGRKTGPFYMDRGDAKSAVHYYERPRKRRAKKKNPKRRRVRVQRGGRLQSGLEDIPQWHTHPRPRAAGTRARITARPKRPKRRKNAVMSPTSQINPNGWRRVRPGTYENNGRRAEDVGSGWVLSGRGMGGHRRKYDSLKDAKRGSAAVRSNPKKTKRRKNPLSPGYRRTLADRDYAIPETRSYPIQTKAQAKRALTFAAWPNNRKNRTRVRRAVFQKYPSLKKAA